MGEFLKKKHPLIRSSLRQAEPRVSELSESVNPEPAIPLPTPAYPSLRTLYYKSFEEQRQQPRSVYI